MDFTKLTPEELSSFFSMYSVTPTGNQYEYAASLFNQIGAQGTFPEAIVNLYIATQLKNKVNVPPDYNVDVLNTNLFLELARILSLPLKDTPENRNRAKIILRMLKSSSIEIVPSMYKGNRMPGDFEWMIQQQQFQDALFLFNDNQEQFMAFRNGRSEGCSVGGGNAIIRPYQCYNPPRSAGIPTGVNGQGYTDLNQAQPYIDIAFERIKQLLNTENYRRVMYSAGRDGRSLGTSIYSPSQSVKEYIVNKIEQLVR